MKGFLIFLLGVVCSASAEAYGAVVSLPVKNDTPDVQQLFVYCYAKEKWHEPFRFKPGDRKLIPFTAGETFYLVFRNCSQRNQQETPVERPYDISDVLRQNPNYELSIRHVVCPAAKYTADRSGWSIFRRRRQAAPSRTNEDVKTFDEIQWVIRR
jgi:hypothetical protein